MKQFDSATEYFPDRKSSHTRILSSDEYFGLDKKTPLKQILVIYPVCLRGITSVSLTYTLTSTHLQDGIL